MTKKSVSVFSFFILIVSIAGSLLYRNHQKQQKNNEVLEANKELFLKIKALQEKEEYEAQQEIIKAKRDSIFNLEKKEREAQIQQIKETIKRLEEEAKQNNTN
ncbi:hypothetical protein U8527_21610 [Kordia algicida OT-1]|uniref:Uncharacterized protein n=1 Tax=Kordia algicida OT-1 TaxID=391587 RepID=A9DQ45_9FLAO|nr:hypothetical protein [Kordia algicida]EDP96570.1 hypothetical protein KAOT1_15443 [Kordia algicida OT-1]